MRPEPNADAVASATTPAAQRAALIVAVLSSFSTPFMSSAINLALPAMARELQLDALLMGWVATSYLLASAMFLVPFGRLADLFGRKRLLIGGLSLYTAGSLLCALAPGGSLLIGFRVVQGIGAASLYSTAIAILTSVYPPGRRGAALGIVAASTYIGLSSGPVLGGILTEHLGWRSLFAVNVPVGLAALVVVLWKLKGEWAEARGERFDLAGGLLFVISLPLLMYGVTRLPSLAGVGLVAGGAAGLAAFLLWEARARSPVLDLRLFRGNRVFAFSNLAALINYSATFAITFLMSLYLQYIQGLGPERSGLVLLAQPVMMAAFSPLAGRLSDRIAPRRIASAGMGIVTVGLAMLAFVWAGSSLAYLVVSLVILGFGFALFSSPNTNAVMGSVERRYFGVASATLATMRVTGMMLSMAVAILLFTLFIGSVQITPEVFPAFLRSLRLAFVIFAVLCAGGVAASLARGTQAPGGTGQA
jgi:EmrB/QacA subfamily drug resistance transporter